MLLIHSSPMASSPHSLLLPLSILILTQCVSLLALTPASSPSPSPPASTKLNLTGILEKGSQFTTLINLLNRTNLISQIEIQLNNSNNGITLLAPTDNAFSNLKSGYLNNLNDQQQIALLQYHVLSKFYTLSDLAQVSNPVRTQASGQLGGNFFLNFTGKSNQVNVTTGVVETQVSNALYTTSPLAVYTLDVVLQPIEFSPNYTSPAPSPSARAKAPSSAGSGTVPSMSAKPKSAAVGKRMGWWLMTGTGILWVVALI